MRVKRKYRWQDRPSKGETLWRVSWQQDHHSIMICFEWPPSLHSPITKHCWTPVNEHPDWFYRVSHRPTDTVHRSSRKIKTSALRKTEKNRRETGDMKRHIHGDRSICTFLIAAKYVSDAAKVLQIMPLYVPTWRTYWFLCALNSPDRKERRTWMKGGLKLSWRWTESGLKMDWKWDFFRESYFSWIEKQLSIFSLFLFLPFVHFTLFW